MPVYTYRREDGTTFDFRQSFSDSPLSVDPETGQKVVRLIQNTGVIFKGSGFYVNDSKSASKKNLSNANGQGAASDAGKDAGAGTGDAGAGDSAVKAEPKTETAKSEPSTPATTTKASSAVPSAAAAD